jgi:hypothetical protein
MWSSGIRRWRVPWSSFVRHACSSGFKRFYPLSYFSLIKLTLPYCVKFLRCTSVGLTLLPKEIFSRQVVKCQCNRTAERPRLHGHRFSQNDNGVLCNACSNRW